jgi:uncharacterized protein (DUF169 family)
MNYADLAGRLEGLLGLEQPAVAISFVDVAPADVPRVKTPSPAGCAYWKMASDGAVFYTIPEDHLSCTIGAYTHGVSLDRAKSDELQSTIQQMIGMHYLQEKEIPQIPHREQPMQVAVYSPLSDSPCAPDVVVIRGDGKSSMLLTEAASAAGIGPQGGIMGRPTCAFLPLTIQSNRLTPSLGCIGNRVYTGLSDSELYLAVPGSKVADLVEELEKIVRANQTLEEFHRARCVGA